MSRHDGEARLVYSTDAPKDESSRKKDPPRPSAAAPSSAKGGVRIRLDRRASGRVVTVVTGLPGPTKQVEELGRTLRAACGAGGTVKDRVVELQGDQREQVEKVLGERGISSRRAGG